MRRAAKKSPAAPAVPPGTVPTLPIPIHCCGEGCDAMTTLVLMGGRRGDEGGLFEDPGWTIGTSESFDDSGGSFFCQSASRRSKTRVLPTSTEGTP